MTQLAIEHHSRQAPDR